MSSSENRRASYRETNKTVVSVMSAVLTVVVMDGPLTAWQIADTLDRNVYTVRPRLTELKAAGKIKEVGTRWCDRTQRPETVWEANDKQLGLFNP